MNDFWIKLKFWSKTALMLAVVIYLLCFFFMNTGTDREVYFWWWYGHVTKTSAFVLASVSFLAGVISTMLIRTTFTTIKQFRVLKAAKAQRELAEMQLKASKLQSLPTVSATATPIERPIT